MIQYKKGYKYQLVKDYEIQTDILPERKRSTRFLSITKKGLLTIKAGYAWDGPSGPGIDTPNFMQSSLIHDAFYQMFRMKKLPTTFRKKADILLRDISREDGMSKLRSFLAFKVVRKFGVLFSKKPKKIYTAP